MLLQWWIVLDKVRERIKKKKKKRPDPLEESREARQVR